MYDVILDVYLKDNVNADVDVNVDADVDSPAKMYM